MPASAIFIMDLKGKILISRNYRGDIPMSVSEKFTKHLAEDEETNLTPIITETDGSVTFVYIKHNNLYLMAMTRHNANAMIILNFLYQLVEVFQDYFSELVEESIRDNFVITYELLDEMMDFGYPQSTEPKILKEYICVQERHKFIAKPPVALTTAVSWYALIHPAILFSQSIYPKLSASTDFHPNL
jgi:AP-1 complex subunit mu